jgi:L-lactate dehydrogenase complex protein LldG
MKETTTKEKILKGVRDALISKKGNPFKDVNFSQPVFQSLQDEYEVTFAQKLIEMGGSFVIYVTFGLKRVRCGVS